MKQQQHEYQHYEFQFDKILQDKECHKLFATFANKSHNSENLDFVTQYDQFVAMQQSEQQDKQANSMYDTFIKESSNKELNIPKHMKDRTLVLIQGKKYDECFTECYYSAYLHLHQLFAHFKRSDMFAKHLQSKGKSYLNTIGQHKSQITNHTMSVQDLERASFEDADLYLFQEMFQDYDYWQFVFADANIGTLMYSTRVFQTDECMKKFGFMAPFKTGFTLNANCTLLQLIQILSTKETIAQFHTMSELHKLDQTISGKHPCIAVHGTINLGGLFSLRHFCEVWTIWHDSKANRYLLVKKTCHHDKYQDQISSKKKKVQIPELVLVSIRQVVPGMFHIEHVACVSFGGILNSSPASTKRILPIFKMATSGVVKNFKQILSSRVDLMNKGVWQPSDDLGLLQTIHHV